MPTIKLDKMTVGGTGRFNDSQFLSELDVQFAQLYFNALKNSLSDAALPDCWQALFSQRNQTALTRIQFAMAGINAHINHDLPIAIVAPARSRISPHSTAPPNTTTTPRSTRPSTV
jgi:hypothetical protein